MAHYEVRLYSWTDRASGKFMRVNQIPFEAADDAEAREKAFSVKIPKWDDSDWALLYGEQGQVGWRIDRER